VPSPPGPDPPLPTLLSEVLVAFTVEFDNLAEERITAAGARRGRTPYLAHTERVLADPRGHLPDHPLVLHRCGFPDGA